MRVLVVDDSVVFRTAIKSALLESDFVDEVDIAANGKIAVDKLKAKQFDSITLDLEMPVMDGIQTIEAIRVFNKDIPIIIFSAQNIKAANKTLEALQMGADDFVSKLTESMDLESNLKMIQEELIPRFKALVERNNRRVKFSSTNQQPETQSVKSVIKPKTVNVNIDSYKPDIICMASSTGGPDMLIQIFKGLQKFDIPVVMVQHMPPIFTTQLANTLNDIGPNTVVEAKIGDTLQPGHFYLAPGDYHMTIKKTSTGADYIISLDKSEKVCFVRPAADVLFKSVTKYFDGKIAGVVLTGMGNDGADGCKSIKERDGKVIIQDEESCVVWGMPRAVYQAGSYDKVSSPDEIIGLLNKLGRK